MNLPIAMAEEYWANSQLSVVRYTGRIQFNNNIYVIVDKRGHTIFECSIEAEKTGKEKAIDPGEPADLVMEQYVPIYRKLGREKFINWLQDKSLDHSVEAAHDYVGLKCPKMYLSNNRKKKR